MDSSSDSLEPTLSNPAESTTSLVRRGPGGQLLPGSVLNPRGITAPKRETVVALVQQAPVARNRKVANALFERAAAGNVQAAQAIMAYQDGLPKRMGEDETPDQVLLGTLRDLAATLRAGAAGELSPGAKLPRVSDYVDGEWEEEPEPGGRL